MRRRPSLLVAVPLAAALALGVAYVRERGERATVQGRVTLPDGRPAAGYQVVSELAPLGSGGMFFALPVFRPVRWTTTTDGEGRYRLSGVRTDGTLLVAVVIPGQGAIASVCPTDLRPGETSTLDIPVAQVRPAAK